MDKRLKPQIAADQPLPTTLVRKFGGWGAQAQNYPMFSPTWFRYRLLSMLLPMFFFGLILAGAGYVATEVVAEIKEPPPLFYGELASTWFVYVFLIIAGRWLATLVYRRHWSQKKEAIGMVIAIVIGIAMATAINECGNHYFESQKELVRGSKSHVRLTFGVSSEPDKAEAGDSDAQAKKDERTHQIEKEASLSAGRVIWAIIVLWLGGILDLYAYFRQRRAFKDAVIQQQLDEQKVLRNEAEMRLSVLAAQIEPHFLFNTLAGVRSAIRSDPARGIVIIDHLVEYLRATIPQMRSDVNTSKVPLQSQLDAARAYLGVMGARLQRLSFSVECEPELLSLPVPPLMLISLVENAIKHGIEPKPGPARIDVLARQVKNADETHIELSVADDGAGFSGAISGSGIGLANIRERLAQLYGARAQFSLKARPQGGVIATISLPVDAADSI